MASTSEELTHEQWSKWLEQPGLLPDTVKDGVLVKFRGRNFGDAVLHLGKRVENLMRERSTAEGTATQVARQLFTGKKATSLLIATRDDGSEVSEQEQDGFGNLIAGAMQWIRNPAAHLEHELHPADAARRLVVLAHIHDVVLGAKQQAARGSAEATNSSTKATKTSRSDSSWSAELRRGKTLLDEVETNRMTISAPPILTDAQLETLVGMEWGRRFQGLGDRSFAQPLPSPAARERVVSGIRDQIREDARMQRARALGLQLVLEVINTGTASIDSLRLDELRADNEVSCSIETGWSGEDFQVTYPQKLLSEDRAQFEIYVRPPSETRIGDLFGFRISMTAKCEHLKPLRKTWDVELKIETAPLLPPFRNDEPDF